MGGRRSLSSVVATVLLVIISIAAAAMIYAWLSGFIGGGLSSSPTPLSVLELQIIGVSVNPTPDGYVNLTVYLLNPSGAAPAVISSVALEYPNGTPIADYSFGAASLSLPRGGEVVELAPVELNAQGNGHGGNSGGGGGSGNGNGHGHGHSHGPPASVTVAPGRAMALSVKMDVGYDSISPGTQVEVIVYVQGGFYVSYPFSWP